LCGIGTKKDRNLIELIFIEAALSKLYDHLKDEPIMPLPEEVTFQCKEFPA